MGGFLIAGMSVGAVALLFAPIFLRADVYFDLRSGKIGACLSLYGLIKVLGGYVAPCPSGLAFHVSDKKALILSFRQMDEGRKTFKQKIGMRLRSVKTVWQIHAEYFFPFYALLNTLKLVMLFPKDPPKVRSLTVYDHSENVRVFARLSFATFFAKELYLKIKDILLGGIKRICQKKKSAI